MPMTDSLVGLITNVIVSRSCGCERTGADTHIHEQVRRGGGLAAHGAGWRRVCWRGGRMSLTHSTRGAAQAARAVCGRRAIATAARRAPTVPRAPTATGCLISHYNLRARFLPSLLPRFVLRIIECIPLAPPPCAPSAAQIIAVCNYAAAAARCRCAARRLATSRVEWPERRI